MGSDSSIARFHVSFVVSFRAVLILQLHAGLFLDLADQRVNLGVRQIAECFQDLVCFINR